MQQKGCQEEQHQWAVHGYVLSKEAICWEVTRANAAHAIIHLVARSRMTTKVVRHSSSDFRLFEAFAAVGVCRAGRPKEFSL